MQEIQVTERVLDNNAIEAIKINQEIIKRMADNSQRLKNYFMAFSGVVIAIIGGAKMEDFVIEGGKVPYISIGFIIIGILFWYMDAKYLCLERQFRKHHNAIVSGKISHLKQFDFNPTVYQTKHIIRIMCDNFSILIYPIIMVVVVAIFVLSSYLPALLQASSTQCLILNTPLSFTHEYDLIK